MTIRFETNPLPLTVFSRYITSNDARMLPLRATAYLSLITTTIMFKSAATKLAHNSTIPALAGNPDLKLLQEVITTEKLVLQSCVRPWLHSDHQFPTPTFQFPETQHGL